jgi:hypothetical protein
MSDDKTPQAAQINVPDADSIFRGSAHATPPDLPPIHSVAIEKPSASDKTKR